MKSLPKTLQAKFPVLKTRQLGITKGLADFILTAASTALSVNAIHTTLKELHGCAYHRRCIRYLAHLQTIKERWTEQYKNMPGWKFNWQAFKFPSGEPPSLFSPPSPDLIADVQLALLRERESFYDNYMASLDSSIVCLDHTFRVAKALLHKGDDGIERPFRSQFGAVNEYGEIPAIVCTRNEQFATLANCLEDLASRGPMKVQFIYVDNCCQVRNQLQKFFPGIVILLDMWHWLQRFARCIPVATAGCMEIHVFYKALTAAMFDDLQQASKVPRVRRKAWERVVPSPEVLTKRLEDIEAKFRDVIQGNAKLRALWPVALEHVRCGCLSDPQGVQLWRKDIFGKFRCCRGTNGSEGYHSQFNEKIMQRGQNGRAMHDAMSRLFAYRVNVKAGIRFRGHTDFHCTDPLILVTARHLYDTFLDEPTSHAFSKIPVARRVNARQPRFFTSYVHEIPEKILIEVPSIQALPESVEALFRGRKPLQMPAGGDFNWNLSLKQCSDTVSFLSLPIASGRSLEESFDDIEELLADEFCAEPACSLWSRMVNSIAGISEETPLSEIDQTETAKLIEAAVNRTPLADFVKYVANSVDIPICVAHFKSEEYFFCCPANFDMGSAWRILVLVQVAVDKWYPYIVPTTPIEKPKEDEQQISTLHPPSKPAVDFPLPLASTRVAASLPLDPLQNDVIVKIREAELKFFFDTVKAHLLKKKDAKNIKWPSFKISFNESVAAQRTDPKTKENEKLRFAKDEKQLATVFQNRRTYTTASEFNKWYDAWKTSPATEVSAKRIRDTDTDKADTEAPSKESRKEQTTAVLSTNQEALCDTTVTKEISLPSVSSMPSTPGLSNSLVHPSPSPARPGFDPSDFCVSGICNVPAITSALHSRGFTEFLDPLGNVHWVNVKTAYPHFDLSTATDAAKDVEREKVSAMSDSPSIRQEQLRSLRPGSCIEDTLIIPAFNEHIQQFIDLKKKVIGIPFHNPRKTDEAAMLRNIQQSTKSNNTSASNSTIFIFLVHYESHFIVVSFDGALLRFWDSLESHAPKVRLCTLKMIADLCEKIPGTNIDKKKKPINAKSAQQQADSNDCGLFALRNSWQAAGVAQLEHETFDRTSLLKFLFP
jgi:hypothetical protein